MHYEQTDTRLAAYRWSIPQPEINAHFSYDYTYDYPWIQRPQGRLYYCEFDGDGYMELTDKYLVIFEDWKKHRFLLKDIMGMQVEFKRLMAPLIIGGIVAPLSFIAAFNTEFFSYWISIASFLIGILLFYYGLQGSHQVSIQFAAHDFRFFIDEKNEEVEELIFYINRLRG